MAKTKYERFTIVYDKWQAQEIVTNLRAQGKKSYYKFGWIIFIEEPEV